MDQIKRNEISHLLLKRYMKKEGIHLDGDMVAEIEKVANDIGVPSQEVLEWTESFVREIVDEMFIQAKNKK
jgi:hypothetical protein